ncbi:hypothetical protein [uncultured Cytophaga sp.]|uniref:beta-propeller domain-containing protein n=1 Tax=uncultured Cytophaga sp. TaxID=160238 RepID=UPI00262A95E8|nr:hypothetical protein [uncultured Cytophaga sp.]
MKKKLLLILFLSSLSFVHAQPFSFVKEISGPTQTPPQYEFYNPTGIASDSEDNIYVVDNENKLISKFSKDGVLIKRWPAMYPVGIAIDANNQIYITQQFYPGVSVYTSDGIFVKKWGSYGNANYQMKAPYGIVLDSDNNVYVTDVDKEAIMKYSNDGTFIKTWATSSNVDGICIDENNLIYTSDSKQGVIICYDVDGNELKRTGNIFVYGIATDKNGYIYLCSQGNITKWDATTFAFTARYGSIGNSDGQFYDTRDLLFAKNGNIYTLEGRLTSGNARVQVFNPSWQYITKWGGIGNEINEFRSPRSFVKTKDGTLYVSDAGNQRIQKISSTGQFISNFSTPPQIYSIALDNDGNIWAAYGQLGVIQYKTDGTIIRNWTKTFGTDDNQFYDVDEIEVDDENNIYVSDLKKVKKFNKEGDLIAVFPLNGLSNNVTGITFDPLSKDVFILAYYYPNAPQVYRFKKDGTLISTWLLSETLSTVRNIKIAKDNLLYIFDGDHHQILGYTLDGTFISSFGIFGCDQGQIGSVSDFLFDENMNLFILEGLANNSGPTIETLHGSFDRIQIFQSESFIPTSVTNGNLNNDSDDISIYPNPCKGVFKIRCNSNQVVSKVTLTNTLGQQEYYYTNDISTQLKGLILLTIQTSNNTFYNSKIIIE